MSGGGAARGRRSRDSRLFEMIASSAEEVAHLEGRAFSLVAHERQGSGAALVHTDAAAHARVPIHSRPAFVQVERAKLALVDTVSAARAQLLRDLANKAG